MKLKTIISSAALAVLAVLGTAVLPAQLLGSASASDDAPVPEVSVHLDNGVNGFRIAHDITQVRVHHQEDFVKKVVDIAFNDAGGRHNVIIQNLRNNYEEHLQGTRLYANVEFDHVHYGLWIADSGSFTNQGRGGYDNWGFKGWFTRTGNHVEFHRP